MQSTGNVLLIGRSVISAGERLHAAAAAATLSRIRWIFSAIVLTRSTLQRIAAHNAARTAAFEFRVELQTVLCYSESSILDFFFVTGKDPDVYYI